MGDKLNKAGDINVKRIEIINSKGHALDVTNQLVRLEIYEDIFAPFISGNLIILDSVDISSALPLIGEERININVQTPSGESINQQFYLYKMSDRDAMNTTAEVFVLHFMSVDGIIDANKRISKTFSGAVSDIAEQLIRASGLHSKKNANIETTRNSQKFTANFWSPVQSIAYTMEQAENLQGDPSYVFFENREGYIFGSLNTLYKVPPIQSFKEDNYVRIIDANGTSQHNVQEDYKRITNKYVPEFYNYLERNQSGFYASTLTTYDITTKKYGYRIFDAKTGTSQNLNDSALVELGTNYHSDALRIFMPKYYGNFDGYTDVTNASSVQARVSLLKQAEALKIQITVPGRVDYTAGRTVNVELYRNSSVRKGDTQKNIVDPVMSGLYLIAAISHQITRDAHICNMELIKDSIIKGG